MRIAAGAALTGILPQSAHATNWTYLRSVSVGSGSGTAGSFPAVNTSDAQLAVAGVMYEYGNPYTLQVKEAGTPFAGFTAGGLGYVNTSIYTLQMQWRILTATSGAEVFTWVANTGPRFFGIILLFGVVGTPAESTVGVAAASAVTPNLTTIAADSLYLAACGRSPSASVPTAVSAGFTPVYGTAGTDCNVSLAYKIEATSGLTDGPTWTVSGGNTATIGGLLVSNGGSAPKARRKVIGGGE